MERVTTALSAIKETGESGANSIGGFLSSSTETGVSAFKGTSLGESFFKNIGAIMVVVLIILGGIIYVDLAESAKKTAAESAKSSKGKGPAGANTNVTPSEPKIIHKKVHIEPNTGIDRALSNDVPWTVPAMSIQNELMEGFGSAYTELEMEKIHTTCNDSFCVMNQKSPEEMERACNSIKTKQMCGTKCCCGWTKYTGFEGDNDPAVVMNTAEANAKASNGISENSKTPGKCVSGNSKRPYDIKDEQNREKDIAYYYYLGECVGGRGCMKKGAVKA
jgi:hypothetical protein